MFEDIKKEILKAVTTRDYQKGMNYEEDYVEYINCTYFSNSHGFMTFIS